MSAITESIREVMMRRDVDFESGSQQEAFRQIKETRTETPVTEYYTVMKPIAITCTASKSGLGAVL